MKVELDSACGMGKGAFAAIECLKERENRCRRWLDVYQEGALKLLDGVVRCEGPKPDGSCGAEFIEPCIEAVDLRATLQPLPPTPTE